LLLLREKAEDLIKLLITDQHLAMVEQCKLHKKRVTDRPN
jgi:hypothetical protein